MNDVVILVEPLKAYDVLNHKILMDKLEICGVMGVLRSWLEYSVSKQNNALLVIQLSQHEKSCLFSVVFQSSLL